MPKLGCGSCEVAKFCTEIREKPEKFRARIKMDQPDAREEAIDLAIARLGLVTARIEGEIPNCEGWGSMKLFTLMPLYWLMDDSSGNFVRNIKMGACGNPYVRSAEGSQWSQEVNYTDVNAAHLQFLADNPDV